MNPCETCGAEMYPSNGERVCRLCRKGIAGFEPGRVIYKDEQLTECRPDPLFKRSAAR